jgi:hypothetical protein
VPFFNKALIRSEPAGVPLDMVIPGV